MSDAWILAAIGPGDPQPCARQGGCTLAQILAAADYLNHAVPTETEFTVAMTRLLGAGLVGTNAGTDGDANGGADVGANTRTDRYWRTPVGQRLYQTSMGRRSPSRWAGVLPPALLALGGPRPVEWSLPTGAFAAAVETYLRTE